MKYGFGRRNAVEQRHRYHWCQVACPLSVLNRKLVDMSAQNSDLMSIGSFFLPFCSLNSPPQYRNIYCRLRCCGTWGPVLLCRSLPNLLLKSPAVFSACKRPQLCFKVCSRQGESWRRSVEQLIFDILNLQPHSTPTKDLQ